MRGAKNMIIIKPFNFLDDLEGWSLVPGDPFVDMALRPKRESTDFFENNRRPDPIVSLLPNSIRTTAVRNDPGEGAPTPTGAAAASDNYIQWMGTLRDLGAPDGYVIQTISLDYDYRWQAWYKQVPKIGLKDTWTGPAQISDEDGNYISNFSDIIYCEPYNNWQQNLNGGRRAWPQDPNWPYPDGGEFPHKTQYPIAEQADAWGTANSNLVRTRPGMNMPSDVVKLTINNHTPAIDFFNLDNPAVRFKQRRIIVTLDCQPLYRKNDNLFLFSN